MTDDLEEFPSDEFDEIERRKVRRLLQDNDRARYLWLIGTKIVIGAGAVVGALTAIKAWILTYVTFK